MSVERDGVMIGRPSRRQLTKRKRQEMVAEPEGSNRYLAPFVARPTGFPGAAAWNAGQRRRRSVIESLGQGTSVRDACAVAGVTETTYQFWRREDLFCDAVEYARATHGKGHLNKEGFVAFRKKYFGFDSYYHHLQIIEAIENAPPMAKTMILVPPEHGKTSVITDYINYKLALEPNMRITVVSEGEGHAKKILGQVQRRMTDPHMARDYVSTFGPFKDEERGGKPWAATHFTVAKADHDERDYSMEARGASSAIYGTRCDLLIFDDIQSRRNLNATNKLLDSIRQDFLSRPGKDGRVVFVGTRVDEGDIYEALEDAGIIDLRVLLPATNPVEVDCPKPKTCDLHEDCCGLHWADGTAVPHESPMCPEMWPVHELAVKRRDVGNVAWLRAYQQRPAAAGTSTFSEEMLDSAKDPLRKVGEHEGGLVVLGLDLALGGQNALIACAVHPDRMDVLDLQVDEGLGRVEQILFRVEQFCAAYNPSVLIAETDTLQKGIARDERLRELAQQYGFMVHEHRTAGQKADDIIGVAMMAGSFSRGEMSIPFGDAYTQRRMSYLLEELAAWRATVATRNLRQDTVMALWFTWRYWQSHKQALIQGAGSAFNRALPKQFARTGIKTLQMTKRTA